jgi:hypothetical protein
MDSDVFIETDNITDSQREFVRDCIYRQDILNVFYMEDFDDDKINFYIEKLHIILKANMSFDKIFVTLGEGDSLVGLMMLFSYDYFHISHPFISECIKTSNVNTMELEKIIFA